MEDVLTQRLEHLKRSTPWIVTEAYISQTQEGDWGLVITVDPRNNVKRYWFFESACSFNRTEAIDQYNTYIDAGFGVTVACPQRTAAALWRKLRKEGREEIEAVSLESMGIYFESGPPRPFAVDGVVPDQHPL